MFGIGLPVDGMVVWGGLWVCQAGLGVQNQGGGVTLRNTQKTRHSSVTNFSKRAPFWTRVEPVWSQGYVTALWHQERGVMMVFGALWSGRGDLGKKGVQTTM